MIDGDFETIFHIWINVDRNPEELTWRWIQYVGLGLLGGLKGVRDDILAVAGVELQFRRLLLCWRITPGGGKKFKF